MPFDYSKSGLPENKKWQSALNMCFGWLNRNMSMFGPERIESFMKHQPISAAKLIMDNCPDWSEESITLALMGPSKGNIIVDENAMDVSRQLFGDRTVDLMLAMAGAAAPDADMERDMIRLFLVEGLSTMNDQLIGRAKIDAHHQVRWNILKELEANFAQVNGQNPGLDKIFGEALVKSRQALEALDAGVKSTPKSPKPPTM